MKKIRFKAERIWSIPIGIIGGFLLVVSLTPVLLSGRNSSVIGQWRDVILEWTQFTGYLRLMFVAAALIVTVAGLVGVIVNFQSLLLVKN